MKRLRCSRFLGRPLTCFYAPGSLGISEARVMVGGGEVDRWGTFESAKVTRFYKLGDGRVQVGL